MVTNFKLFDMQCHSILIIAHLKNSDGLRALQRRSNDQTLAYHRHKAVSNFSRIILLFSNDGMAPALWHFACLL